MADVAVNIKVQADVNALTAIKKELKEMKALALNGDGAAAKRVAELTDNLEDLKDTTKSLRGDGVERLQTSFGLLKDSLFTGDAGKFSTALKGIGSAMSAIPLLLLVEGFKLLVDNFDEVIKFGKMLFGMFSDNEKAVRSLTKELERQKDLNKTLTAGLEDEIKILEAQGASNEKIIAKKRELNALKIKELEIDARLQIARIKEILDNDTLIDSYNRKFAAGLRSLGQDAKADEILKMIDVDKAARAKEAADKAKEDIINIQHLKTEDRVNDIKHDKELAKAKKEIAREVADDTRKADKEQRDFLAKMAQEKEKEEKEEEDKRAKLREDMKAQKLKQDQEEVAAFAEKEKQLTELKKQEDATRLQIEKQSIAAAQILSELFFQAQLNAAEGDSARQLEIKKKAFNVNKAFQASQAGIDGVRATLSAFASAPPGFKIAAAAAAGIFAAAQVAKILSAKFNGGATASGGNIGGGGADKLTSGAPLGGQLPQNQTRGQDSTTYDERGNKTGGTMWVSVSEINKVQNNVARVAEQARF